MPHCHPLLLLNLQSCKTPCGLCDDMYLRCHDSCMCGAGQWLFPVWPAANSRCRLSMPASYTVPPTCPGCLLIAAGHSLGGALATLAAYDLRKRVQGGGRGEVEVLCYTFGAPRTGNHAFATDYNHVVPDTWSIINDQASLAAAVHFPLSLTSKLSVPSSTHMPTLSCNARGHCDCQACHFHSVSAQVLLCGLGVWV